MARIAILAEGSSAHDSLFVPSWQGDPASLRAFYQSALSRAAGDGRSTVSFSLPAEPPLPQTAAAALRAIMDFLWEQPLPQQVRLLCPTESAAALYRQTYNLWYAEDKAGRL